VRNVDVRMYMMECLQYRLFAALVILPPSYGTVIPTVVRISDPPTIPHRFLIKMFNFSAELFCVFVVEGFCNFEGTDTLR
jgi:hypothetical protein